MHFAEPTGLHLHQPGTASRAELDGAGAHGQQLGAAAANGPGPADGRAQVQSIGRPLMCMQKIEIISVDLDLIFLDHLI